MTTTQQPKNNLVTYRSALREGIPAEGQMLTLSMQQPDVGDFTSNGFEIRANYERGNAAVLSLYSPEDDISVVTKAVLGTACITAIARGDIADWHDVSKVPRMVDDHRGHYFSPG